MLEVVVLIGFQGAGKSTFCAQRFGAAHAVVSKDLFRKPPPQTRRAVAISEALAAGKSVVVDNTNPSVQERARIIETARAAGARVVGYFFDSSLAECAARNEARTGHARVPEGGLRATARRLVRPSRPEGFNELWTVRTLPDARFEIAPVR